MTTTGAPQHGLQTGSRLSFARSPRLWIIAGLLLLVILVTVGFVLASKPYRYSRIKPMLEQTFGCEVTIRSYRQTYFPSPGFVAEGLTLRRKTALKQPPVATIQQLYVQSHWTDFLLFRKRIHLYQIVHAHILLPPPGSEAHRQAFPPGSGADFSGPDTPIQRFEARDLTIEILRKKGGSFVFPVSELHIEDMQKGHTWTYAVSMNNAFPTGMIVASGQFGPLNKTVGATMVSGRFRFTHVNLHDLGNVWGTVSSFGTFKGRLDALQTEATSAAPDFAVSDGHPTALAGAVRCVVNGTNGDVFFQNMEVLTGSTLLRAQGQVAGSPHETNLDITVARGRAEDILRPFLHGQVPITGPVSLHAHAYLAPTREGGFLHRLKVDGAFTVPSERITDRETEKSLTAFSQRAQGAKDSDAAETSQETDALSSISGPAQIKDGIVTTNDVTFDVAGAQAVLHGTFNFHTSAVHLTGKLRMQSDISHSATGFKSILLKPLAPFFRKKHAGAEVSIAVTGTKRHYKIEQNITHTK